MIDVVASWGPVRWYGQARGHEATFPGAQRLTHQGTLRGCVVQVEGWWNGEYKPPSHHGSAREPAVEGLRAHEQSGPGWARQNPAQRGEQEAVGGLPARAADLAFENPELVTDGKHLRPQPEL